MTGPGSHDPAASSDDVRAVRFRKSLPGYYAPAVDHLLRRVAAELDAGRPVASLITNTQLPSAGQVAGGYDVDAVDWFLDQLCLPQGHPGPDGEDPWRDLGEVAQLTRSEISGPAGRPAGRERLAPEKLFAGECANAWRNFGQAPGTRLVWGREKAGSHELRTPEAQAIASLRGYGPFRTASTGGRTFTLRKTRLSRSSPPGFAEIAARIERDYSGHFAENRHTWIPKIGPRYRVEELTDETGTPVLYPSGPNLAFRAWASITFPDQRRLRFLVRGTGQRNAIMTAVDQAGNRAVRYRVISGGYFAGDTIEIIVHPGWKLTDELALAIVISAPWLPRYFQVAGEGG